MPDRNEAWELLCEYTKGESLRKHALTVEAAMRACVKRYGSAEDNEDEWGLVGLLHDFDYEMFPTAEQHPFTGANILCGRGYSERFIRAIMGHATYTGVPRDTAMAADAMNLAETPSAVRARSPAPLLTRTWRNSVRPSCSSSRTPPEK